MVTKISLPYYNSIAVVSDVVDERERYKLFYALLKPQLINHLRNYIKYKGNPEFINPLELSMFTTDVDNRKKSLINLYKPKEDQSLYQILRNMRSNHGLNFCPSCGEEGAPDTLDHYLPKDSFPEFSFSPINLVPMCSKCQTKKGKDYLSVNKSKVFLHPYYDDCENTVFKIEFIGDLRNPYFELDVTNNIDRELRDIIIAHTISLNLVERMQSKFKDLHISLMRTIARNRQATDPCSARQILRLFIDNQNHDNSWLKIYYLSVLEDAVMIDFLENGQLPNNI